MKWTQTFDDRGQLPKLSVYVSSLNPTRKGKLKLKLKWNLAVYIHFRAISNWNIVGDDVNVAVSW